MKRTAALIISLILLISLAIPATAATPSPFLMQEYEVGKDQVFFYGKPLPPGGYLEVSVGADVIGDSIFTTLGEQNFPVTVYCLVDCATTVSDSKIKKRNDVLLTISSLMSPEDTMIIGSMDSKLTESKPLTDKEIRDTAIESISGYTWNTNLLDGISQAMDNLRTSTAYGMNRYLIVISDAHDDGNSKATKDSILKKIEGSGIPVYTVLLDTSSSTEKDIKRYQQFADASLGGFMVSPEKEKITCAVAGEKIWDSIKATTLIAVPQAALANRGEDSQVLFRYETQEERYEDTVLVHAVDLPSGIAQEPKETAPPLDPTKETEPDEPDDPIELTTEMMLAIGFGVILLGIGIAAYFILRKKPETPDNAALDTLDLQATAPVDGFDSGNDFSNTQATVFTDSGFDNGFNSGSFDAPSFGGSGSSVTTPVMDRCHVSAVAIMHSEVSADFYLTPNMETTFGRTGNADIILNPKDKKLSSCHGCFLWNGKILLVQDRNSTNGTAVNGEVCPKNVWLRLENGAVLTAGNYEYRITFNVETH